MNEIQYPQSIDISLSPIKINDRTFITTIKVIKFVDRLLIFVTNSGRVGHITELSFPLIYQTPGICFSGQAKHYETRTLLGPDTEDYDLLVARIAKILIDCGQCGCSIWLMLGLDLDSLKEIHYLKNIANQLQEYFSSLNNLLKH